MPFLKETTGKCDLVDVTVVFEALDAIEGFEVASEQDESISDRGNFWDSATFWFVSFLDFPTRSSNFSNAFRFFFVKRARIECLSGLVSVDVLGPRFLVW